MECDWYRHMPPSVILSHCLSMMQCDFVNSGIGRTVIRSNHGAVWMISSMSIRQYKSLCVGDTIKYVTYPRIIDGKKYVFRIDIYRDEEMLVEFATNFMAVEESSRKIVPVEVLEQHWTSPPEYAAERYLQSIKPEVEFLDAGGDTVRMSDCDSNGHMTSGAYLSLVCDALGYWGREEGTMMRFMQVDFRSEVHPGDYIKYECCNYEGIKYMRGLKDEDKIAFIAKCDF